MRRSLALVPTLALVAVLVAGCGSAGSGTTAPPGAPSLPAAAADTPGMPVEPSATAGPGSSVAPTLDPTAATTEDPAAAARAALAPRAWATATLTDVETGQSFAIADFAGRTVFVEAMAIWCTNCRRQQGRFTEALSGIDPAAVAYVVLTIEPSESGEDLARYEARNGFLGTYAVAGRDVAAALEAEFGPNVLNPPTVPLIVVTPAGEVRFGTGGESVDEIVATVGG